MTGILIFVWKEDYEDPDYYDEYESGDYEDDYYEEASGAEEDYEDYDGSGESEGDFYEYETKYYYIPYCHKREEQQRTLTKDIDLYFFSWVNSTSGDNTKYLENVKIK